MRIEAIEPGTRSALAELEQQIQAERGRISPLYQVLLHSPAIAKGWEQMLSAVRNYSSIDAGLRELIILRVAMLNQAAYEFEAHVPHALKAGVTQAAIDTTRDTGSTASPAWDGLQQLVIAVTDALTRDLQVPEPLFAQVAARFNAQEQVELFATIGAYNMVSRFLNAFEIGH